MTDDNIQIYDISDIAIEPELFQIRSGMNKQAVARYKKAFENNSYMPPVTVAAVKGVKYLVDGFHRVEALKQLNYTVVEAKTIRVRNLKEARWLAASDNITHGLPITKKDHERVFTAYVEAGQCRDKLWRKWKSCYEIAQELGFLSKSTIRRWMMKKYPDIWCMMKEDNYKGGSFDLKEYLKNQPSMEEKARWKRAKQVQLLLDETKSVYMQYVALNREQREKVKRAMKEAIKGFEAYDKEEWKGLPDKGEVFKDTAYEQYIQCNQKRVTEEEGYY